MGNTLDQHRAAIGSFAARQNKRKVSTSLLAISQNKKKKRWIAEKKREDLMKQIGEPPDNLSKSGQKQWIKKKEEEIRKAENEKKTASTPSESKYEEKNRSNTNEKTVLEAVQREYEGKDCFIFHSFTTGIDGEVVKQVCSEIKNQVVNSKSNFRQMAAIERKLRRLAKLACVDWVQVEPSDQNLSDKDFLSSLTDNFKKALNQKSQEKDIVIVSLSQQAIIHIEVKSSRPDSGLKQLTQFE